jgi:adiponectin receptor
MKYSRHPEKFANPDPELQRQWLELKDVLCDNEHMVGYKIMVGQPVTIGTVWNILTTLHTDTTNIWSHLIGLAIFLIWGILTRFPVNVCAFCGAMTCLMSASYHTFRNYSRRLYDMCLIFDVLSINLQLWGFFIGDVAAYFLETRPGLFWGYMGLMCAVCGPTIMAVPYLLRHKLYSIRTCLFTCEAALDFPLLLHRWLLDGADDRLRAHVRWKLGSLALAGLGLCFRSSHVPERFLPRTIFQRLFHSHFVFHILSVMSTCVVVRSIGILQ